MVNLDSVEALEELMSRPAPALEADLAKTQGDILILGVGGKMGPTLARLAKRAAAEMGGVEPAEIEELWHALKPPYEDLFAWLEGRSEKPTAEHPARFRPVMLAQAIDEALMGTTLLPR